MPTPCTRHAHAISTPQAGADAATLPLPPGAHASRKPRQNSCKFWEEGRCGRGLNCQFWHNPALAQRDAAQQLNEARWAELAQLSSLAHAAALLGRRAACRHAMARAKALLALLDADGAAAGVEAGGEAEDEMGESMSLTFRRGEMRREVTRLTAFTRAGATPRLGRYFCRSFVFSSRLLSETQQGAGGAAAAAAATAAEAASPSQQAAAEQLLAALRLTFGLEQAARLGLASVARCERRLHRMLSPQGTLRWERIFRTDGQPSALPLKLEVASGTGDWVAAQALAEVGAANWAALELRHDRVYDIFSRMVLQAVPNLAVIGGDAAQVLADHVAPRSVAHIFVNFPEPPHRAIGRGAGIDVESTTNALAMLNPSFFRAMHGALSPGGMLTILSDNKDYVRSLAATVAALREHEGGGPASPRLLHSVALPEHEGEPRGSVEGVHVYAGMPGPSAGHAVESKSYFDRFWEHGQHTGRHYLVLRRPA